jgi:hypothetical protein
MPPKSRKRKAKQVHKLSDLVKAAESQSAPKKEAGPKLKPEQADIGGQVALLPESSTKPRKKLIKQIKGAKIVSPVNDAAVRGSKWKSLELDWMHSWVPPKLRIRTAFDGDPEQAIAPDWIESINGKLLWLMAAMNEGRENRTSAGDVAERYWETEGVRRFPLAPSAFVVWFRLYALCFLSFAHICIMLSARPPRNDEVRVRKPGADQRYKSLERLRYRLGAHDTR